MKNFAYLCRETPCRHEPECREIPDFLTPPHGVMVRCPWCGEEQMIQHAVDDYVVQKGTEVLVAWMWKCDYYDHSIPGYPCRKPIVYVVETRRILGLWDFLRLNPNTECYVEAQRKKEKIL